MRVAGIAWFAAHEARLARRDWRLLSGRGMSVALGAAFVLLHAVASLVMHPAPDLADHPTKAALITIVSTLVLSWSLMLSQALELVTRAFYTRGDLELILSSPVAVWRLFAVRIVAMAATLSAMALAISAPFVDVLAWRGGARWLALYPEVLALATIAVGLAIVAVVALFRIFGPKRTRVIAQIASAFIAAIFVVILQVGAIRSLGVADRAKFLNSPSMQAGLPDTDNPIWGLGYAAMGYPVSLGVLVGFAVLFLGAVIAVYAPRFHRYVLAAGDAGHQGRARGGSGFGSASSPSQVLRRKEWALLRRDPWLVSQTLVQLLYLVPAGYALWRVFSVHIGAVAVVVVPVLVTVSGQFAGGLAWLAISGEDAPDLIGTAPVPAALVVRAKFEATIGGTLTVFAPFLLVLAMASPRAALAATVGIVLAAGSATAIQYWFRLQATRGRIRRRQTASRLTTYTEAIVSMSWAGTAAIAAANIRLAFVPAFVALLVLAMAWSLRPRRT